MRRWLLPVLAALSIGIVVEYWILLSRDPEAPRDMRQAESEAPALGADTRDAPLPPIPRARVSQVRAALDGVRRSPFQALDEARAEARLHYHLTGTLVSDGQQVAWIDGRPRVVGDWLGSSSLYVSRIEAGRAVLSGGPDPIELRVEPESLGAIESPPKGLDSNPLEVEGEGGKR